MTEDDRIIKIIRATIHELKDDRKEFWIQPETHYKSHEGLDKLISVYETTNSILVKAFIGLVLIGGLVLAGIGIGWEALKILKH